MCGRAIGALPSYIREYQLRNALKLTFPTARFYQDEQMDKKFHCDIKMDLDNQTYYFWSFISSQRSITQFMDKFKNHRYGNILDGIHVLCPFDRFNERFATYNGWCFYSDKYIREIKNSILFKSHVNYEAVINRVTIDIKEFRNPIIVDKNTTSFSYTV